MLLLLALACAEEEKPYPFDQIRHGRDDSGDTSDTGGPDTELDPYTVAYAGVVATVSGTPFGFDASVREARVAGSFTWNRALRDQEDDPDRGLYVHAGSGAFTLDVAGRTVGGSGSPEVEVEDLSSDTFRFVDGAAIFGEHVQRMTVDGVEDESVGVWIAITDGSGAALDDDAIPTTWPFPDITTLPHTFSVEDADGTLLLQLDALGQA